MPLVISLLVVLLSIFVSQPCAGNDLQVMKDLSAIYKSPEDSDPENYFKTHGKSLLEQAAMLDAMALAKRGLDKEARDELKYMVLQTFLAELPDDYRSVGELVKLVTSDRSYFSNTLFMAQQYIDATEVKIKKKVSTYGSSQKTDGDKKRAKEQITSVVKEDQKIAELRANLELVWKLDFQKMKRLGEGSGPGTKQMRAWQMYGKVKILAKRLKFTVPFGPNGKFGGPIADVFGMVIGTFGLAESISTGNTKGVVKNTIAIVGGITGLVAFGFVTQGASMAGPIGALAGVAFTVIIPLLIDLLWPSNLAIETANKLSEVSRKDLNGYLSQLKEMRDEDKKSFGWIYQANTGVLIKKGIIPDSIVRFRQPSCASQGSPCNPKKYTYDGKRYLVLGESRRSTDSRSQFQLDMPYDFIGVPTESHYCGNTITINTWSFRRYIEKLDFELFEWEVKKKIGYYHRNIEIDTKNVPQYNEVNMNEWRRSKRSSISNKTTDQLEDEIEEIKCEPESDRISIDELEYLDPNNGKIKIETGPGKDLLSINSMIGKVDGHKSDFIVADLGAGVNMLSLGSTLGIGKTKPGELLVGAVFENDNGQGKVCYLREDFKSQRCVGSIRNVQIFKGSRLSDTVYIGADGPFTIIQNHGTNLYFFDISRIYPIALINGKPLRYQIMDYSGNTPQITFYNLAVISHTGLDVKGVDKDKPGLVYLMTHGVRIAQIDITGLVTRPDIYHENSQETICICPTYDG